MDVESGPSNPSNCPLGEMTEMFATTNSRMTSGLLRLAAAALILGIASAWTTAAWGQDLDELPATPAPAAKAAPAAQEPAAAPKADGEQPKAKGKIEIPEPLELKGSEFVTKDGVQLHATFYGAPHVKDQPSKDAVPVILLHSYKGDGKEFGALAEYLQREGCAVLVPDLRGHGESNQVRTSAGLKTVENTRLTKADFGQMVELDMSVWHRFLVQRNDEAELNLDKLCLVGSEMGASVALRYALRDWSYHDLPGRRQGHFVKGLVLISPQFNFHGLDSNEVVSNPLVRSQLSVLILVGKKNATALRDARGIFNKLKAGAPATSPDEEGPKKYLRELNTKLQGSQMLGSDDKEVNSEQFISGFIKFGLPAKEIPWQTIKTKPAGGQ
jgi:pimeloyl-ACP methyl ester carboxylesterase